MDRLERLTDLVLVLLDAARPLTLTEIAGAVVGYPEAREPRRQAFERDKRTLREEGIVLTVEPLPDEPTQVGYRIREQDYYLPQLDLTPDEQVALNLAVAGVHLDDPTGRDALLKLGMVERDGPAAVAALPPVPGLPALHEATRSRAPVRFGYRGRERTVDPYAIVFRRGWWYVVGRDHESGQRTFRVDRMESPPVAGPPGSFPAPEGLDPSSLVAEVPWELGEDEPEAAKVRVDSMMAGDVVSQLGEEAVAARGPDGSVVVNLAVVNSEAFCSWVLGLLDHAVVLAPPSLRDQLVSRLQAMAGAAAPSRGASPEAAAAARPGGAASGGTASGAPEAE